MPERRTDWHPFPGHPGNDPGPKQQAGRAHPDASRPLAYGEGLQVSSWSETWAGGSACIALHTLSLCCWCPLLCCPTHQATHP